jgi:molybdopterin synthase catalytic subunit
MKTVHLLFFATLKERAGVGRAELDLAEDADVSALKAQVARRFPPLAPLLGHALVAVNQSYAFDADPVPAGAEVALFPPVSGGAEESPTVFQIADQPLDLDELVRRITLPTTGAACVFTGMVRGVTRRGEPHETVCLEYEAYAPMAEAKMAQVAREIRERWPAVEGIAIVQRIGLLEPGMPTVLIACTAAHRDTGVFEAARYGIDRLKEIVPVWKKEIGPGGEVWVEGDYQPRRGD